MTTSNPKVLVVDDMRSMRMTLSATMEDQGYDVTEVEDGYQAIDAVGEKSFDLIFMDIKMPGINGVQTFREIKKISPRSVVIMMTGFAVQDLLKEALDEGAFSVLHKPFEIDRLVELVESALGVDILVVDDRSADRQILGEILQGKGYRVNEAAGGHEAIEMAKSENYDVIFMDIKMPTADGVSVFQEIRAGDQDARVIFMTGFELEDSIKQAIETGGHPVAYKPFDVENTLDLVDQLVSEKSG